MRKIRAFTLIELMVVIAIVGIIAAMILPALKSAASKTKPAAPVTLVASASGNVLARPTKYVTDLVGALPADMAAALNERLAQLERDTTAQVLVYVAGAMPENDTIEALSNRTYRDWAVGQKDKNNGAILFVFKDSRKMRLEVGYGLEAVIPDAVAKRIIAEQLVPKFKVSDYAGGISAAVSTIEGLVRSPANTSSQVASKEGGSHSPFSGSGLSSSSSPLTASSSDSPSQSRSSTPSSAQRAQAQANQATRAAGRPVAARPAAEAPAESGNLGYWLLGGTLLFGLAGLAGFAINLSNSRRNLVATIDRLETNTDVVRGERDYVRREREMVAEQLATALGQVARLKDQVFQLKDPAGWARREKEKAEAEAARLEAARAAEQETNRRRRAAAAAAALVPVVAAAAVSRPSRRSSSSSSSLRSNDDDSRRDSSPSRSSSSDDSPSSSSFSSGGGSSGGGGGGASGEW